MRHIAYQFHVPSSIGVDQCSPFDRNEADAQRMWGEARIQASLGVFKEGTCRRKGKVPRSRFDKCAYSHFAGCDGYFVDAATRVAARSSSATHSWSMNSIPVGQLSNVISIDDKTATCRRCRSNISSPPVPKEQRGIRPRWIGLAAMCYYRCDYHLYPEPQMCWEQG